MWLADIFLKVAYLVFRFWPLIAIFSGAQLFALGVIGEYLARMHFRTMNRPAYAIRNTTERENLKTQSQ